MEFLQKHNFNKTIELSDVTNDVLKFTLYLNNLSYLPSTGVDDIIKTVDNFVSQLFIPYVKQNINEQLNGIVKKEVISQINFILDQNTNHFKKFK